MATYHVRFSDGRYLGENGRIVTSVLDALILSRAGAIHQSHELNAQGADSCPVRLGRNDKVTRVRTESR
jgi:hypothetical protein